LEVHGFFRDLVARYQDSGGDGDRRKRDPAWVSRENGARYHGADALDFPRLRRSRQGGQGDRTEESPRHGSEAVVKEAASCPIVHVIPAAENRDAVGDLYTIPVLGRVPADATGRVVTECVATAVAFGDANPDIPRGRWQPRKEVAALV
jgi:hypothetical protein